MICCRLRLAAARSCPRSASLAPCSSTNTWTGCRSSQSIRRSPAAEVSPLTPALTVRKPSPAESIFCCTSAGYASSGSSPSPAVRLVPKNSTTGRSSPAATPGVASRARSSAPPAPAAPAPSLRSPPQATAEHANSQITIRIMMIVAEDLEQTYLSGGKPLTVLRQINLAVEPQEFVAIIGPSGSGKTTLLGLLAGLDRPTRGIVRLDGEDLSRLSEDARARLRAAKVGFVLDRKSVV